MMTLRLFLVVLLAGSSFTRPKHFLIETEDEAEDKIAPAEEPKPKPEPKSEPKLEPKPELESEPETELDQNDDEEEDEEEEDVKGGVDCGSDYSDKPMKSAQEKFIFHQWELKCKGTVNTLREGDDGSDYWGGDGVFL